MAGKGIKGTGTAQVGGAESNKHQDKRGTRRKVRKRVS